MTMPDDDFRHADTVDLGPEAPLCPPPPPRGAAGTTPVFEYARRRPGNGAATASLVWGLLMFIPFLSGILAIRFGRRGLDAAREIGGDGRGRARAGIVLGWINIVASILFLATLPPAFIRARRAAEMVQCASQLRQIALAAILYSNANKGLLPPSFDAIYRAKLAPASLFVCPACARDASKPVGTVPFGACSYIYGTPWGKPMRPFANPAYTVLAYEPLTDHGSRGINVVFVDGHVEFLMSAPAAQAIKELNAGQNPPPSLLPTFSLGPPLIPPARRPASSASTSRPAPR